MEGDGEAAGAAEAPFEGAAEEGGEDEDGEELPGLVEGLGDCEVDGPVSDLEVEGVISYAGKIINSSAVTQIKVEHALDLIQQAVVFPLGVTAEAGLPGGILRREEIPGLGGDEFVEDAVQDGAFVDGRAAADGEGGWR